jgi:hypothetical protein
VHMRACECECGRERERERERERSGEVWYRFDRERTRRGTIHHTHARAITLECTKSPTRAIN